MSLRARKEKSLKTTIRKENYTKAPVIKTIATITFHAKKRYAERVLGVSWEGSESKRYVYENEMEVYQHMKPKITRAELLFENYRPDPNNQSVINHIYICDDILFIFSTKYHLVTVWKIKHANTYKTGYRDTVKWSKNVLNNNVKRINSIDKRLKKLGQKRSEYYFAIKQLQEVLDSSGNQSTEVEKRIEMLTGVEESLKFEGTMLSGEKEDLVRENRKIMQRILYKFVY